MEAKDTVMGEEEQDTCTPTKEQLDAYIAEPDDETASLLRATISKGQFREICKGILYGKNVAEAQAEITWDKAIREVVEFALKYMNDIWGYDYSGKRVDDWKAKLREWGVDKPKKCPHQNTTIVDDKKYCADCNAVLEEENDG